MRSLAKPHEPRHVAHGDRGLLDQQLGGDFQAAGQQVLAKSHLAELGVDAGELARRGGERPRDPVERQRPPVVARDHNTGLQVQATALIDRGGTHIPYSDRRGPTGQQMLPEQTNRM
jgi:hypothetical protein